MTAVTLYDVAAVVERLKIKARREITTRIAADYIARGGTVPPTDEQQLLTLTTQYTAAAHASVLGESHQRAEALTDEELEAICEWYEEAFFETASSDDYEVDDRSEASIECLDALLTELGVGAAVEGAVERTRVTLRKSMRTWQEWEAADDAVVTFAAELGVKVEHASGMVELRVTVRDDEDFVSKAVEAVLYHVDEDRIGPDDPEVKRITEVDMEGGGLYIEVTVTDGRTFAVRGETK